MIFLSIGYQWNNVIWDSIIPLADYISQMNETMITDDDVASNKTETQP